MAFEKQPDNLLESTAFLPDFCGLRTVFVVVVLSELLAFLIMLASPYEYPLSWDRLGVISLFIQWVALSSTAILCISRRWLSKLNDTVAGYTSYAIVLLVTLLISEASYWLLQYMGLEQDADWHGEFLLRNMSISAILSALALRIIYLQHQQKLHMRAHANARIQALQARIRPHFLFNSMNTIAALIRAQPDNAEAAVEDLSDLFRASINNAAQLVTLAEEKEIASRYLHIEQLRLGERLQIEWDIDDLPVNALLPVLTLQPLIENAIYHGIELLPEGGVIRVEGKRQGEWMNIIITNPCPGAGDKQHNAGNRMAVKNINERLLISFGSPAGLKLVREPRSCQVDIIFPYKVST